MKILYDDVSYSKEDFVELIIDSTLSKEDKTLIDLFELIYLHLVSVNSSNATALQKIKPLLLFVFACGSTVNQLKEKRKVIIES